MSHPPIKIAIMAMGGEGGGVLADWIVDLAEQHGHIAQSTSVPGVAQRTGATIYYLELYPAARAAADGAMPVLALMPLPGDVDVVLASELMEAARAVQRGLVTPQRTILITSTHRVYAIAEKSAMGDGRVDSRALLAHAQAAARRCIGFDMAQAAAASSSVVSAVLFGALAGAGVLPFERAQFEATVARSGVGVQASLAAFAAGYEGAVRALEPAAAPTGEPAPEPMARVAPAPRHPQVRRLVERVQQGFDGAAQPIVLEGVRRLIDYQDLAYAGAYLDRLDALVRSGGHIGGELLASAARHLALWMSYEDTARVAALKTRALRFDRVRQEARAQPDQVLSIHEYLHPRLQEICETLPAGLGRWLMNSGAPRRWVERATRRGRVVQTSSLRGFALLRCVAAAKRWRRSTLRYEQENGLIEEWLADIAWAAAPNPALALEVARSQRLVKGYGDTHARGLAHYRLVRAAWRRAGATLAGATLRGWCDAALADEDGRQLRDALARYESA